MILVPSDTPSEGDRLARRGRCPLLSVGSPVAVHADESRVAVVVVVLIIIRRCISIHSLVENKIPSNTYVQSMF